MNIRFIVSIFVTIFACTPSNAYALEYRKCNIDVVITGVGVPPTPIPGSDFVAWARTDSGTNSAKAMNALIHSCVGYAISGDRAVLPGGCETNTRFLNNSDRRGRGLTAFSLTNGLSALKNTICQSNIGTNYNRTNADQSFDKRRIEGFRVSYRKKGGTGACRGQQFYPTQTVEVMCKAHREMLRLERPIARMYRVENGWPVPNMCKEPVTAQGGGASIPAARLNANRVWQTSVIQRYGSGFENTKKRKDSDMKCTKRLSGEPKVLCKLTSTPCYF